MTNAKHRVLFEWSSKVCVLLGLALCLVAGALAQTSDEEVARQVVQAADLYRAGKLPEAVARLEELAAKAPENPDALSWLGFLYLRQDQPAKALPLLEKAALKRPSDLEVANNLGNAYLSTKQDDKALAQYKKIASLSPKMYEPWYNIGAIHLRKKQYQDALTALRKAEELKPDDAFVHNNLGVALEGAGQYLDSAREYAKAAVLRPDQLLFARNAGFAYLRVRDDASALPYLERASKEKDADLKVCVALAELYARSNRKRDAAALMEKLQDRLGNTAAYWFNLGVVRSGSGDAAGAEKAYRKALDIDSADLDTLNNLGLMLFKKGAFEEAKTMFEKLVGLDPKSKNAQLNLASCCARTGELKRAADLWKAFLRAEPLRVDVRVDLGSALWQLGDKEGSRAHFVEALKTDKTNPSALNGVGLYRLDRSELQDADRLFRSAIASKKDFLPAYNNLAVTLERLNRRKEAIDVLQRALRINPQYADAKKNLERMKAAR